MVWEALLSMLVLMAWVVIPAFLAALSLNLWEAHKRQQEAIQRSRAARSRASTHISWEKP